LIHICLLVDRDGLELGQLLVFLVGLEDVEVEIVKAIVRVLVKVLDNVRSKLVVARPDNFMNIGTHFLRHTGELIFGTGRQFLKSLECLETQLPLTQQTLQLVSMEHRRDGARV